MVEVGIPLYKGRETIRDALDSLVAQTHKRFITCISIDGDDDDYNDIIEEYKHRGLNIRVIHSKENGGAGAARQRVLDTTQCDFIMFLDADDMLMPQAIRSLYDNIRYNDFDILRAGFIREEKHKQDVLIPSDIPTITWFHGKIYKVSYLKQKNIQFLPGLRTDEDAYFNLLAWNSTQKRGQINDIVYLWRDNRNSITRTDGGSAYFKKTYVSYVYGQVCGLKQLYKSNNEINGSLVTQTLINIYTYYMQAKYYKLNLDEVEFILGMLKEEPWINAYLNNGQNWIELVNNVKAGTIIEDCVVFYKEPINLWISRLIRKEGFKVET